jgi:hypothetical protein
MCKEIKARNYRSPYKEELYTLSMTIPAKIRVSWEAEMCKNLAKIALLKPQRVYTLDEWVGILLLQEEQEVG